MIKMVVFDMAGTTVDEDNVVYKTLQKAINEAGFKVTLEQVLEHGAGKEKLQAIIDVLQNELNINDLKTAKEIHANFKTQLVEAYAKLNVKPTKNAEQVFSALRNNGIYVALDTGYDRKTAESLLGKLGWQTGNQIDVMVTASDVPNNRPMPDMILEAMKLCKITDASEVIKIGDSGIDIEEGKNAGCKYSIGVTGGAQTREQMQAANPDFIFDDLGGLLTLIGN